MSEITPHMRAFADRVAASAAKKSSGEIVEQGKAVGLKNEIRAKYKIEVMFGPGRTTAGPNRFGVSLWESGKRLNGGGDDLAFWCISESQNEGCGGIIISEHVRGGIAFCPHCKRAVNAEMLTQLRIGFMTTDNLATELEKLFRRLDSNADIYLKYDKKDMRVVAMEKAHGSEKARRLRGLHIYPLKNILKDTAAGASLQGRIKAFLTS